MNITSKRIQDHLIIVIDGRIDTTTASQFYNECTLLQKEKAGHIILDFSRVKHISAHGIHRLLLLMDYLKKQKKELIVFQVDEKIRTLLDELSLSQHIPIYLNEIAALEHFTENKSCEDQKS